jgi:hypothetical protein
MISIEWLQDTEQGSPEQPLCENTEARSQESEYIVEEVWEVWKVQEVGEVGLDGSLYVQPEYSDFRLLFPSGF